MLVHTAEVAGLPSGFDHSPREQVDLAHAFVCCMCTAESESLVSPWLSFGLFVVWNLIKHGGGFGDGNVLGKLA